MACNVKGVNVFKINGISYTVRTIGSISPSNKKKESVTNLIGDADFKETGMAPSIKGVELSVTKEDSVKTLIELCDATIQVEMKDGKAWTLTGASQTADGEYSAEEGTVTLDFEGKKMAEL